MKQRCAQKAYEMIQDGMVIGLGGGSTVALLIHEIDKRKQKNPGSDAIAGYAAAVRGTPDSDAAACYDGYGESCI